MHERLIKVKVRGDFCIFEEIQNTNSSQTGIHDPSSSQNTDNTSQSKDKTSERMRRSCIYWGYSDDGSTIDRSRKRGEEGEEGLDFDAREGAEI